MARRSVSKADSQSLSVPLDYPSTVIYVDESGTTNDNLMVVGALKVRSHGQLMRRIRTVRERHDEWGEIKWTKTSDRNTAIRKDFLDAVGSADTVFAACVVDSSKVRLRDLSAQAWEQHMIVVRQLLVGAINKRELVSVVCDQITTPAEVAYEDELRNRINNRFGNQSVVSSILLDSASSDGLQLVDLLVGAVRYSLANEAGPKRNSTKQQLSDYAASSLGVGRLEIRERTRRVNIRGFQSTTARQQELDFKATRRPT